MFWSLSGQSLPQYSLPRGTGTPAQHWSPAQQVSPFAQLAVSAEQEPPLPPAPLAPLAPPTPPTPPAPPAPPAPEGQRSMPLLQAPFSQRAQGQAFVPSSQS